MEKYNKNNKDEPAAKKSKKEPKKKEAKKSPPSKGKKGKSKEEVEDSDTDRNRWISIRAYEYIIFGQIIWISIQIYKIRPNIF